MRFARKLFLLVLTAFATMAFAASTASAQVEVYDEEDGGVHCTACLVHVSNSTAVPLLAHITSPVVAEITVINCSWEMTASIGEDGEGSVINATLAGAAGTCTRQPCGGNGNLGANSWPLHIVEHGSGDEEVDITFCLEPVGGGADVSCPISLPLAETGHEQTIGDNTVGVGRPCIGSNPVVELQGLFMTEVSPHRDEENEPQETEIEVAHP